MLSYSRGALLALLVGLAFWFAVVPLRLRGVLPLIVAAFARRRWSAWAFARDALSTDAIPLAARADAGHELGALLLLLSVVLLAAGLAVDFLAARRPPRRAPARLVGPRAGGVARAAAWSRRAIARRRGAGRASTGQTSKAGTQLTDPTAGTPTNTPDRLTATSSVRARYWHEALDDLRDSRLVGRRRGRLRVARTRYRRDTLSVRHAHGYGVQTLADLGLVGLGAVAARDRRVARSRRCARPGCGGAIAGCPSTPSGSGC